MELWSLSYRSIVFIIMNLFNFEIFTGAIDNVFLQDERQCIVNTINPHSFIVSLGDPKFHEALKSSDVLLPDGSGILLASYIINGKKIDRITGPSALDAALYHFNKKHSRVYFLGANEKTLLTIRQKINKKYNNIEVQTHSPSFSDKFTESENRKMLNDIEEFNPDLLCVGMTAPKQEKWVYINKSDLPDCCIMSIGAAFDWFSGVKKPPSKISRKLHLAWFERFLREPIRMMPRIKSMLHFLYIVFKIKVKKIIK
jgi:N-acetylglucosaminyldiphosphoundecaprenol N-acetyl-beta-D-mannosaminyltransferase